MMNKNESIFSILKAISEKSTCQRRKISALITKNGELVSTGVNGPKHDISICYRDGCNKDKNNIASGTRHEMCLGVHAEQSAINNASKSGKKLAGSVMYCTTKPCCMCAKSIVESGIKEVYYFEDYKDVIADEILKSIKLVKLYV